MTRKNLRTLSHLLLPLMLFSGSAKADAPRVVADIAPIHSLVAMVMDGVGQPQLLVPQNISPHHYSMRPSEAGALQRGSTGRLCGSRYVTVVRAGSPNTCSICKRAGSVERG